MKVFYKLPVLHLTSVKLKFDMIYRRLNKFEEHLSRCISGLFEWLFLVEIYLVTIIQHNFAKNSKYSK